MFSESKIAKVFASATLAAAIAGAVIAAAPEPPATPPAAAAPAPAPAAGPPPQATELDVLDEVVVAAKSVIKLDDFVDWATYDNVKLSPSGKRLTAGFIDGNNGHARAVRIFEFPSMKLITNYALAATFSQSDVTWLSEKRLMLQANWPVRTIVPTIEPLGMIRLIDFDSGNAHSINIESLSGGGGDPLLMHRREEAVVLAAKRHERDPTSKLVDRNAFGPTRLFSVKSLEPDHVLLQTMRSHDRSGNPDTSGAFLLNLSNNKQTRIASLPVNGGTFVMGPGYRIALATGVTADNETVVYYLPENVRNGGLDWQLVSRSKSNERGLRPVAWTGTGEEYYALDGRGAGTRSVVIWDAVANTQRVVHRNPNADIDHVAVDPSGKAYLFSGTDHFPYYWYPDPEHPLARLHRAVAHKVHDELVEITSASDDMKTAVVRASSGRRPPIYMVVNVDQASSLASFFSYPTLRGTRLSQVDPIEFRARDGVVIRGYLTTPEDGSNKPRTGLPLVVLAQGGPLDKPAGPGYEYERQMFASRGYAVLQINQRGSSGRGAAFERLGDRKWGREVQDDFVDAVRWAVRDGVADGQRVCIYGVGWGAFSALTAAARMPEQFKCVIGVGGVYDLPRYFGEHKADLPVALQKVLGTDEREWQLRSPVNVAPYIKAQVYLLPQERDEYFPADQSVRMRLALKDAGITAAWDTLGVEYNGNHTQATRASSYDKIFKFLEKNIGDKSLGK